MVNQYKGRQLSSGSIEDSEQAQCGSEQQTIGTVSDTGRSHKQVRNVSELHIQAGCGRRVWPLMASFFVTSS